MKIGFVCLIFLHVLTESYGYRRCAYSTYSYSLRKTVTYYYSCSNSQYCCGTTSCCTYVYARWYLWCTLVTLIVIAFIFWWYYRYRYRPRQVVVASSSTSPGVVTAGNMNVVRVNAPYPQYPGYPQSGPVTIMPGGSNVHYAAYPPPVYAFQAPPPAYSSVVNQGTTVVTRTSVQ
ncbi:hypothetical protein OS493_033832 [Desmophyllum pertusum]|uniref:Vesicular, overexpressed in cancer, prosurvival protein 1 n=1 Tax=Desmophyllum pertusum TaxID=174260 RepID=A0A9W9YVI4_9CNID|nr:hypothetical protein OS493_033832 [Desmophyllum pertusum]